MRATVFDSGVGGLWVLARLRKGLPRMDFTYVSDSEGAPYGNKDSAWVRARVCKILDGVQSDLTVLACNTATAVAQKALQEQGRVVYGIAPAVQKARADGRAYCVLCTPLTAKTRYAGLNECTVCLPWLAPRIEQAVVQGGQDLPAVAREVATHLVAPVVVIGCTHYAFLTPYLREQGVVVYDGAEGLCKSVMRCAKNEGYGTLRFVGTDYTDLLQKIACGKFGAL